MRRFFLAAGMAASIALVGCGDATGTITLTASSGQTLSLVVTVSPAGKDDLVAQVPRLRIGDGPITFLRLIVAREKSSVAVRAG